MRLGMRLRKMAMVAAASVALAVVSAPNAMAQGGRGGPGGFGGFGGAQMYEPSVSSRDLDGFAKLFGLDASQKDAAKALFDAYQQQFVGAAKKVREEQDAIREELRESRDPQLFGEMREKMAAWQKNRDEMENSFLGDFKAVLTDEQTAKWPKFERMRRRETTIGRGLMSGERVDLFKLVDDLKLAPEQRAALDPTLEQYEVDLDRELIERNKMQTEIQEKIRDFFSDPEKADEWIKKGREAAVKVRDVNRKYFAQLDTQIPADKKPEFETAFKKESFPQIYREQYSSRVVEAAMKLPDLNDDQKSGLQAIRDSYYRDMATLQHDMEKAQEEQEMNFSFSGMMNRRGGGNNNNNNRGGGNRGQGGPGGGGFFDSGPMGELRTKRGELESGTVDKIKALLNEKQVDALPTRGADDGPGRGRGGNNADNNNNQPRRRGGGGNAPRQPERDQ